MAVRALGPNDAHLFRELRLEALKTSPEAFSSSYDVEIEFDDATWRGRLGGFADRVGRILVDERDGMPVAMAGIGFTETSGSAILWGMWVRSSERGNGSGARLVQAAVAWATEQGATDVILQVALDNDAAFRLYGRLGFSQIGEVAADPDDPCFMARLMSLEL